MSYDLECIYALLPAIYRIRDAEQHGALKALLSVLADQARILEDNLDQLYKDQFVETCAPWVLPYLADLIGITGLPGAGPQLRTPRAEVAHTIAYRRRKGTAATLEQLARDITGWPARAVECFELLAATQYMNHIRPRNEAVVSVRNADRLAFLDTAFEHVPAEPADQLDQRRPMPADITHTVDVRSVRHGSGRYNIPDVAVFLWPRVAYSLTRSPAVPDSAGDKRRFRFHSLGIDSQLATRPRTEIDFAGLADPINVPLPISRRLAAANLDDYYGSGKSFVVQRPHEAQPLDSSQVVICNLDGWKNLPTTKVAIDPALGRIAFPSDEADPPLVTFHYTFSGNMGGGEYTRGNAAVPGSIKVAKYGAADFRNIADALSALGPEGGTVEILDSSRYAEALTLETTARRVEIRAAEKCRPTVVLTGDLAIGGSEETEIAFSGLLIAGGNLQVRKQLRSLVLSHCTLVPGIDLNPSGKPQQDRPSLIVTSPQTEVSLDHCIVGGIRTAQDVSVSIAASIVDAGTIGEIAAEMRVAFAAPDEVSHGGTLQVVDSTVIGKVNARVLALASNTIFLAYTSAAEAAQWSSALLVGRRQQGCVRFCHLPAGARVPKRYRCQPATDADAARVHPVLLSTRYGDPGYCELSPSTPSEIRRGADDESEMGVFHEQYRAQRETHLRARLDEYLRFGLEAGIFYAK